MHVVQLFQAVIAQLVCCNLCIPLMVSVFTLDINIDLLTSFKKDKINTQKTIILQKTFKVSFRLGKVYRMLHNT